MIWSKRLLLRPQNLDHLEALRTYYLENHDHLQPWEPQRSDDFHDTSSWQARVEMVIEEQRCDRTLKLVIHRREDEQVIGVCNYTNIIRGSFQACHLGYSLAESAQGQGYMREALQASLQHVFTAMNLRRVMANYVPENDRSGRLLERLGFEKEGLARQYLEINGVWRDHILTSKRNPVFRTATRA